MSDHRAIVGTSSTLKGLLDTYLQSAQDGRPPTVTVAVPNPAVGEDVGRRINLFLYQLTENAGLKNQDVRGGPPGAYGAPPLALDLHYLLTPFGGPDDADDFPQELLGDAMRVFHDHAVVRTADLAPELVGAVERLTVTFEPLTLEELTKIWSALTLSYRLSVGYKVTVVQIESRRPHEYPRLVADRPKGPRVAVTPIHRPRITEVRVRRAGDAANTSRPVPYARVGDTLVIRGTSLVGDVYLGPVAVPATARTDSQVEVVVPDAAAVPPGPVPVLVRADMMLGEPPIAHLGPASNLGVFVLVPRVTNATVNAANITVSGTWVYLTDRDSLTLVGDRVIRAVDYTTKTATQIVFPRPGGLAAGTYPVRVRVQGSESLDEAEVTLP